MSNSPATAWEKFKGYLFHLFPHHLISRITYWLTRQRLPFLQQLIQLFIKAFNVDMRDAQIENIHTYTTFNEFFTRELKPDARPIDTDVNNIISPCDGKISELGNIDQNSLLQAKQKYFSIEEFLTPQCNFLDKFIDGQFCTIYLSPRDYHRVHVPCAAQLIEMIYVPGRLFSVAPYAPKAIDKLYARNERVISIFAVKEGYLALTMVGAVNVAAIEMAWEGLITPPHQSKPVYYNYVAKPNKIELGRGDHAGTFNMGSTVVVMFSKNLSTLKGDLKPGQAIQMGQTIASIK